MAQLLKERARKPVIENAIVFPVTKFLNVTATQNWRDPRSAQRYSHVVAREEWDRVDNLPAMGSTRGKTDAA